MTQDINTEYNRFLRRPEKAPVYIIEFEGIPDRYSDKQVQNPLASTKVYLKSVSGAGSQITIDEGRSSIGNVTFSIIDKNQDITNMVYTFNTLNVKTTIKTGFVDMDEADYVTVFVGRVLNYSLERDNVSWKFVVTNLWKQAKKDVFTALTTLTAGINDAVTTVPVANAVNFASATGAAAGFKFYIRIGDEVISYTGTTATSFTGCTRGEYGTAPAAHSSGDECNNFIVLEGNAIDIALWILTSTGAGTNGVYDVLPASAGLAIPEAEIAIAKMEVERDRWLKAMIFKFELWEREEGKHFLESEVFRFINSYPVVDNEGRISVRVYTPPLPTIDIQDLNDNNMPGAPVWQGQIMDRYFFNEVEMEYDFSWSTGNFLTRTLYEETTSQAKYQQVKTMKMQSRGLRVGTISQNKVDNIALRVFKRFANPSPRLSARSFFSKRIIEPGDIVTLNSSKIPDLTRGVLSVIDKMVEVVKADFDYKRGMNIFSLIDTEFSYGRKYAAISPSAKAPINFPTWDAATPSQRLYAFISKEISPTEGRMSDGSDGYYITP